MYRAFTLLESLFVLLIISLLLALALPAWQTNQEQNILNQESRKLYTFIRQVQARVENSSEIWFLVANRDLSKQEWCLTAQVKSDQICDCFSPQHCSTSLSALFYYPAFPQKTMLSSKKYYPAELSRLSGIRNTYSTACFLLQTERYRLLFSLFNVGSLKVKDNQSLSACQEDSE